MNLNTERVEKFRLTGAIESALQKDSQEYYVLAVLRYLFPIKYSQVITGERPDLQGEEIGVEVTIAEDEKTMKTNRAFAQYCEGINKEKNKKKIEKLQQYRLEEKNDCKLLNSGGGGIDVLEKTLLQMAVVRKNKSVKKYLDQRFQRMELAVLKTEIPSSEFRKNVINWVQEVSKDNNVEIFDRIYVIGGDSCFWYNRDGSFGKKEISKEISGKLKKIARMTAEKILTLDDMEWKNPNEDPEDPGVRPCVQLRVYSPVGGSPIK